MRVCIFCSSARYIADEYRQEAYRLGEEIARRGHTLVYGGATGGLMTSVAEGAHAHGGEIVGVLADRIVRMGRQSDLPDRVVETPDFGTRKRCLREESDCFVVLPGGYGTMDEMFDIISSGVIGEHHKPLFVVNLSGFYDPLLEQIRHMKTLHAIPAEECYRPVVTDSVDECLERLEELAEPARK